jgi:hypothetical protein
MKKNSKHSVKLFFKLLVLFFTLSCVPANCTWREWKEDKKPIPRQFGLETTTAALRLAAIVVNQYTQNKCDKDSKKAIIIGILVGLARLINDCTSLCNEADAFQEKPITETLAGKLTQKNRKSIIYSDLVTILPIFYDALDINLRVKKIRNNSLNQKLMSQNSNPHISKLIEGINKYVPFIEGLLAIARVGTKKWLNDYLIQSCTTFLTLTRVAEFYAQEAINDSSKIKILTLCVAALSIIAEISDCIIIKRKILKKKY